MSDLVYYNDNDPWCCRLLRERVAAGDLPAGFVDDRDITTIEPDELARYGQKHLFAGIGGFPLGFRWAGMPSEFDVITGGFPCQDISNAGKRAGIDGERSGLWSEYARLIRGLRPRYVVVENVAALLHRGMERVLGDLAACGYDAEWQSIRAADVGAPHRRERIWIIAYPGSEQHKSGCATDERPPGEVFSTSDAARDLRGRERWQRSGDGSGERNVSHPVFAGLEGPECSKLAAAGEGRPDADAARPGWWATEPNVGRVAHGIPARVDRLRGLGNAIVPQIPEILARLILNHASHTRTG